MKRKKLITAVCVVAMSHLLSIPSFASGWTRGISKALWWYDLGNGNYHKSSWQWLDGNKDGIAECYLFDEDGWMYENTTTPDGYEVNQDGAWTVGDVVQTKRLIAIPKPSSSRSSGSSRSLSEAGSGGSNNQSTDNNSNVADAGTGNTSTDNNSSVADADTGNTSREQENSADTRSDADNTNVENQETEIERNVEQEEVPKHLQILNLINEQREAEGLRTLDIDENLTEMAGIRATESITSFTHTRPNGRHAITIFDEYGYEDPIAYSGEILAKGDVSARELVEAWLNDRGKRFQLMYRDYTHIGISIVQNPQDELNKYNYCLIFYDMENGARR